MGAKLRVLSGLCALVNYQMAVEAFCAGDFSRQDRSASPHCNSLGTRRS
jgi:hypothetical protein